MVYFEFGAAEKQHLEVNSVFISFNFGWDEQSKLMFNNALAIIKGYWNRIFHGKPTFEWEVPFSCFEEIKQLYLDKGFQIMYKNEPPKAKKVTQSDIINGMDFNGFTPYDYQLQGVEYGLNHPNWLLLDEQGLGKTLQAITLARYKKLHHNMKHCLIVCGVNSLKYNWVKEIDKFCKDEKGIILGAKRNTKNKIVSMSVEDTKKQIEQEPEEFFWIINIEKMRYDSKDKGNNIVDYLNKHIENNKLGLVVIDEVHKIKNANSSQAKGILALNTKVNKMAMTGTLLVNNPYDLYAPMSLIGLINYNKWTFEKKFVVKDDWGQVVGYQNMEELHSILYRSALRRTKALLDLPEKMYKQEWLEFNDKEQQIFNEVTGSIEAKHLDKIEPITELMAVITRMRQTTVAAELLTSMKTGSTKFDRLNDILEEARMNGQKVLVFCPFTEALKLGLEYCKEYKPKLICGGMGSTIQDIVNEHESSEGFSVIFAQEATLGVGYTLTNTSIVVFLSPPWNQANYDQCIDRTHRIGQKRNVLVIDLLIKNTYDECIFKKLHGKGAMGKAVIDGQEIEQLQDYFKDMNITFTKNENNVIKLSNTLFDNL